MFDNLAGYSRISLARLLDYARSAALPGWNCNDTSKRSF
jgi:hypothetical protein